MAVVEIPRARVIARADDHWNEALKQRAKPIVPGAGTELIAGDLLLAQLSALASPHRLRILARLSEGGRQYVSQLARDVGMSRPLLHLHLQKLEEAGLVTSKLELSDDGKALNYFEAADFEIKLTPASLNQAVKSLSATISKGD